MHSGLIEKALCELSMRARLHTTICGDTPEVKNCRKMPFLLQTAWSTHAATHFTTAFSIKNRKKKGTEKTRIGSGFTRFQGIQLRATVRIDSRSNRNSFSSWYSRWKFRLPLSAAVRTGCNHSMKPPGCGGTIALSRMRASVAFDIASNTSPRIPPSSRTATV